MSSRFVKDAEPKKEAQYLPKDTILCVYNCSKEKKTIDPLTKERGKGQKEKNL